MTAVSRCVPSPARRHRGRVHQAGRHQVGRHQAGRTLIELMIAMAISVVVLLGISLYYSSSSQTARAAKQMSSLHEDAPLAMLVMGSMVRRAGYGEIVGTGFNPDGQTLMAGPHLRACTRSQFVDPDAGDFNCTGSSDSDALLVRFQAEAIVAAQQRMTPPCTSNVPTLVTITDPVHIGNGLNVPMVQSVFELFDGSLACADIGSPGQILAHDVTEFRVFFGYDQAAAALAVGGGAAAAATGARLLDANGVRAAQAAFPPGSRSAWDYVVSVHLCLVMRTRQASSSAIGGGFTYNGCPTNVAEAATGVGPSRTAADGTVHKTFHQVVTVRARATGSPSVSL